jgi:hypothetical protein
MTLIPIRLAAPWSSATARIALPIFVRFTSTWSPQSIRRAAAISTSDFTEMSTVSLSSYRWFSASIVG